MRSIRARHDKNCARWSRPFVRISPRAEYLPSPLPLGPVGTESAGRSVVYHLNDFKLLCPSYNMVARGRSCDRCHGGRFWHVMTEGCYAGPPGATLVLAAEAYLHKWLRSYETCVTRFLVPSHFVKQKLVENRWDAEKISVLLIFKTCRQRWPLSR